MQVLTTRRQVLDIVDEWITQEFEWLAYDIETTGLVAQIDNVLIIALSNGTEHIAIDCTRGLSAKEAYTILKPLLEHRRVLGHNLAFDWKFAFNYGVEIGVHAQAHDTMIAEQMLYAGLFLPTGFSLKGVSSRRLNIQRDKEIRNEFVENRELVLEERHFEYALEDVVTLFEIYRQQMEEMQRNDLMRVYDLEMQLIPVTAWMEYNGLPVKRDELEALIEPFQDLEHRANQALQKLFIRSGVCETILVSGNGYEGLNLNSNKQVLEALHTMGIDLPSFDQKEVLRWDVKATRGMDVDYKEALGIVGEDEDDDLAQAIIAYEGLKHPILRAISFRKAAEKLLGSYILGLLKRIENYGNGDRIYGWFKQMGASATGRYSSNLQQLPNDKKLKRLSMPYSIRGTIATDPDWRIVLADYQGIELGILADLSRDERLAGEYLDGDIHLAVIRTAFGALTPLAAQITEENKDKGAFKMLRDASKRVSYATAYGVTGISLSEQLTIDLAPLNIKVSVEQADEILHAWKTVTFPKAGAFLQKSSLNAIEKGFTASPWGRKRFYDLAFLQQNKWRRFAAMREGSNQPIQASSADMTKYAMVLLYQRLNRKLCRIIASVHDEIILESHVSYAETAAKLLKECMEEAAIAVLPLIGPEIEVKAHIREKYDK